VAPTRSGEHGHQTTVSTSLWLQNFIAKSHMSASTDQHVYLFVFADVQRFPHPGFGQRYRRAFFIHYD